MKEKFQRPENSVQWLDKQFSKTKTRSPFVQALLDKAHVDFREQFKEDESAPDKLKTTKPIKKRIDERINGEQGEEYAYAFGQLKYRMGLEKERQDDAHYRFWEAKAIAYREALLLMKYHRPKPSIEHVIVELET